MKKSKVLLFVSLFSLLAGLLTSCSFIDKIIDVIGGENGDNGGVTTPSLDDGATVNISVDSSLSSGENVLKPTDYELSLSMDDLVNHGVYNISYLPSLGEAKILVLPIDLSSLVPTTPYKPTSTITNNINKAFFADSSDSSLYYESVASFYKKSSYGKLNISGDVASWYDVTKSGYKSLSQIRSEDDVIQIMNDAIQALHIDTSKYDGNKDGIIDGVWMIYNYYDYATASQMGINISDNYWAYTFWDQENKTPSVTKPVSNVFAWASYDFLLEGGASKIDAHTLIHETGHMLGLNDYYDYNENGAPTGLVDMMDANVIDHNFYSKMVLGWAKPYIVTGDVNIQLSTTNNENNFVIVPYNNLPIRTTNGKKYFNPYDEYMLVEYYSPTGLNEKDSVNKYPGNNVQGFTKEGFRVYHIDARLWYLRYTNGIYSTNYYKNQVLTNNDYLVKATTNTGEGSAENEELIYYGVKDLDSSIKFENNVYVSNYYNEIMLIDEANRYNDINVPYKNKLTNKLAVADNNCLFNKGDAFTINSYSSAFIKGMFSNKEEFNSNIIFK